MGIWGLVDTRAGEISIGDPLAVRLKLPAIDKRDIAGNSGVEQARRGGGAGRCCPRWSVPPCSRMGRVFAVTGEVAGTRARAPIGARPLRREARPVERP